MFHPAGSELTIAKALHLAYQRVRHRVRGQIRAFLLALRLGGLSVGDRRGHRSEAGGLRPAFAAARTRVGLVVLLFALGALAWWWTVDRMSGMDQGPGADLGMLGWFLGVGVVMMAAMMFPSISPTVALYVCV